MKVNWGKKPRKQSKVWRGYRKSLECSKLQRRWTVKENPYVHDKNGKHVSNSEEVYKIMKDHFKCNFYEESIIHCPHLLGSTKTSINELQHKKWDKHLKSQQQQGCWTRQNIHWICRICSCIRSCIYPRIIKPCPQKSWNIGYYCSYFDCS